MGFYLSIFFSVVSRLVPHPVNFTPIGSIVFLNSKKSFYIGASVALLAMIISDIFLGFNFASPFVYLGFISYALIARFVKINSFLAVILSSTAFFIISNFGVWLGPWYSHTPAGLTACFINALPFFRNTLFADVGFLAVFTFAHFIIRKFNLEFRLNKGGIWPQKLKPVILKKK